MTKPNAKKPNPALAARVHHALPKRVAWQKLLDFGETQRKSAPGITVRLSRLGPTSLDVDNLAGGAKFLVDQLRYCGLIPGDRPEEITLEFSQLKTQHKNESGTLVEIFFSEPRDPALEKASPNGTGT